MALLVRREMVLAYGWVGVTAAPDCIPAKPVASRSHVNEWIGQYYGVYGQRVPVIRYEHDVPQ